ncbi:MAG TPA: DNA internalization-related competence protein ComEC/Rec2, partial [Steroidobacteraceae bacterium]|nr:DNA internalization-related competence protein ComEC/Rec2 [Steroidobacteraceae bacterium]
GAVGALFLAGGGRIGLHSKAREYFRSQTVVTIGLAPLLIGTFGNLSLISPLVNLIAIPFFTLAIVPLVLIATLLLTMSTTLGAALLQWVDRILEWTWPAFEWSSRLPLAMWPLPQVPWWAFALLVAGAMVMIAPGVLATRLAGALLCLPAIFWQPTRPKDGEFELTALDVGQGLAVAVRTRDHVLIYDTGPNFRGGRDTGELVLVPFLHAVGIRAIDAVVISHGDADHVGGLQSLLAAVPTQRLLLGPSVAQQEHSELCASGLNSRWNEVDFEIVHPSSDTNTIPSARKRRNDTSCVLRIRGSGGSVLLFGDIEAPAEQQLIAANALTQTDIVTVPHHGSRTSSSPALIAATSPQYALVSAGFGNRFGFPKSDVLARWQDSGAEVLETATGGAIAIAVTRQGALAPRAYRLNEPRYWRQ